jgi:hypothetical protein
MHQATLFEELERVSHIERLTRSMEKWRAQELDRILPEDYAYYCQLICHLKAGGAYKVTHCDPVSSFNDPKFKQSKLGQMFREIGAGLAGISRAEITHTNRKKRNA